MFSKNSLASPCTVLGISGLGNRIARIQIYSHFSSEFVYISQPVYILQIGVQRDDCYFAEGPLIILFSYFSNSQFS
jgi:hypothetical protein